ncbi:class I SAM-dependent methyltransferase [Salinibacter sp.]|uniref:class I SAM-dependent methyltransferase n=1 Tax=Salinibacter sp. TaxID=2065818 RepID=UPI0021E850F4|nr:class I SAM-dependent methyltransferase [Salinibacter sp.]
MIDSRMIDRLLTADPNPREVRPSVYSVLPTGAQSASYDARASSYDRVVGSWLYNRLLWGASTESYRAFARDALADGEGPLLDAGAGSAVFTADAYARSSRPLLLVDCSAGMLEAARDRIARQSGGELPGRITLLQADATSLPVQAESADTVLSMALFHLIEDLEGLLEELFRVLRPGGRLFATSLVTDRKVGRQYLWLLHKTGEIATPIAQRELKQVVRGALGQRPRIRREGNMAFLSAKKQ